MALGNAFGTFLETRDLLRRGEQAPEPSQTQSDGGSSDATLALLRGSFPVSMPDLMARNQLSLDQFTAALNRLNSAGLVTLTTTSDGQQTVDLTPQGAALVAT